MSQRPLECKQNVPAWIRWTALGCAIIAGGCDRRQVSLPNVIVSQATDVSKNSSAETSESPSSDNTAETTDSKLGNETAPTKENTNTKPTVAPPAANADAAKLIKITFDDLVINMQADVVFRPIMLTERAQELDGKRISVTGYIHGGVDKAKGITEFILLRNLECKFGPGGKADHLISVKMQGETSVDFTDKVIEVEGVLKLNPFAGPDGNTWSIYDLAADSAKISRRSKLSE